VAEIVSSDTASQILEAAFKLLTRVGYVRLSTRVIAAEAGVNHALIHYYFGTKDRLVIAALDEGNRRRLDRQTAMYNQPGSFAQKWAQARQFYQDDLSSGFVQVQMELWAASLSNPELAREFKPRIMEWRRVIEAAVSDALAYYELELPVPSTALACWISEFWLGMEFSMLLGLTEAEAHHGQALDAMQLLLETLENRSKAGLKE
jgi:AcrR family transcriptional regulator